VGGLLGPAEVRDLAELLGVSPTKKLGQNFVHDANTVRRIVQAAGLTPGERVLEVGPGLGSLTLGLLDAGHPVVAVEIDPRLAAQLPMTVAELQPSAELTVLTADAMTVDAATLSAPDGAPIIPTALVANLPYNVSVPVLLHLLAALPSIERVLVMVQAEVGHRIAAAPGSKIYGSPSVKAAWYGDWRVAGTISRQVFWPVPNVDSVLVGMRARRVPGDDELRRRTFQLVDAAFGQRRKMLRQALADVFGSSAAASAALEAAGLDPTARGEQLGLDAFLALARVDRS
jgi:16S rRNA (adenine1518-N6/adenine1519-N6)-dimethyltransferase